MAYDPHQDRRPIADPRVRSNASIIVWVCQSIVAVFAAVLIPPQGYIAAAIVIPLTAWAIFKELRKP